MLLSVDQLAKSYGDRELFHELGFHIGPGMKVALVARNGTGKSSLLRILAGLEEADSGRVRYHPDVRVSFLPQEPEMDPEASILEAVFEADLPQLKAVSRYENLVARQVSGAELDEVVAEMERLGAWDVENRAKQVLSRLDLGDFDRLVGQLSGGERKRVALAKVLVEEPDLLILDEPTNHLDLAMVEWLEEFLIREKRAILMVTHDRYFLDRVCSEILELDGEGLHRYKGNYGYFLEQKALRQEVRSRTIERARGILRTELEWARRAPKARGTKSKYRMETVRELREFARQRIADDPLEIDIQMERLGSKVLELHHVRKAFGEKRILEDLHYKFKRPDRMGIVGPNGSGKTTLLEILTGALEPDGGKVVRGATLKIGYYTQSGMRLKPGQRVIDVIRDIAEFIPMWGGKKLYAAQLLERFLFDRKQQQQFVSTLSGGEKRRLYLLTILMANPNFLILDEPTNDLDILTLNVLEDFLLRFDGCLVVVSHDRYFMDKLVDHLFVFEGEGAIRDFPGNYSAYRQASQNGTLSPMPGRERLVDPAAEKSKADKPKPREKVKTKLSFNEKREFEQLEKDIAELEERKIELETRIGLGNLGHEELRACSEQLSSTLVDLEQKSDRWLELSEFA